MKWDAKDKYFPFRTSWKNLITWYRGDNGYRLSAMNDKLETNTVLLEQLRCSTNAKNNETYFTVGTLKKERSG